jgi:hypothetical protein
MEPLTTGMAILGALMAVGGAVDAMRRRRIEDAKTRVEAHEPSTATVGPA